MSTTRTPFESEYFYHVYNHARGNDQLFDEERDYFTFLGLIRKYILPVAEIYSYCLMPNHFHFLIRNKLIEIPDTFSSKNENYYFSHRWGNVQNTFTKKKNYRSGKRGGLFCQSISRNQIGSEEYLQMCIAYIHNNPVKHGFAMYPEEWEYSSYNAIISDRKTEIERIKVIDLFDTKLNFIDYHKSNADEIFAEKYKLP